MLSAGQPPREYRIDTGGFASDVKQLAGDHRAIARDMRRAVAAAYDLGRNDYKKPDR